MSFLKTCPHCEGRGYISRFENDENECRAWSEKCVVCEGTGSILFPETNADHIRAMSDEELAEFLNRVHVDPCSSCCGNLYWCRRNNAPEPVCQKHFLKWLQQPCEGE